MEDTIKTGDLILGTRYGIEGEDIERYDILFFYPPDSPDELFVKRVIGLPGETIEVSGGCVYADGTELDDSFIRRPMNGRGDGIYVVPDGCYFFSGITGTSRTTAGSGQKNMFRLKISWEKRNLSYLP